MHPKVLCGNGDGEIREPVVASCMSLFSLMPGAEV